MSDAESKKGDAGSKDVKDVPVNVVATVTDGRLWCPMGEIYQFYAHVTGHDGIMTHHLPAYMRGLRIFKHCGIEPGPLMDAINDYQASARAVKANFDDTGAPEASIRMHARNVKRWLADRGYKETYRFGYRQFGNFPQPDLTDGIPNDKPIVIVDGGRTGQK